MRKKNITMAIVLALLAALCVAEQFLVFRMTQDALSQTQEVLSLIRTGELAEASKKTHALDKAWDEKAKWLEMLVDHSATDDVRFALSKLTAAMESGDDSATLIYAGELEGCIEHVYERQEVTVENLL